MESKLRRLYLYAANTKATLKQPIETVEEFTGKKQKNITHLKELLTANSELPPISSLLLDIRKQKNQSSIHQRKTSEPIKPQHYLKTKAKFKKTSKFIQASEVNNSQQQQQPIQINLKPAMEDQIQKKYEKYINEYVKKIQEQNLLDDVDCSHEELVKRACDQIREQVKREEKEKRMKEKKERKDREKFVKQGNKKGGEDKEVFKSLHHEDKGRKKNQKMGSLSKIVKKKLESSRTLEPSTSRKLELSIGQNNKKDLRKLFKEDPEQKSQMQVSKKLFELNLETLRKKNDFNDRERKRSVQDFAKSLYKHSFNYLGIRSIEKIKY